MEFLVANNSTNLLHSLPKHGMLQSNSAGSLITAKLDWLWAEDTQSIQSLDVQHIRTLGLVV